MEKLSGLYDAAHGNGQTIHSSEVPKIKNAVRDSLERGACSFLVRSCKLGAWSLFPLAVIPQPRRASSCATAVSAVWLIQTKTSADLAEAARPAYTNGLWNLIGGG